MREVAVYNERLGILCLYFCPYMLITISHAEDKSFYAGEEYLEAAETLTGGGKAEDQ